MNIAGGVTGRFIMNIAGGVTGRSVWIIQCLWYFTYGSMAVPIRVGWATARPVHYNSGYVIGRLSGKVIITLHMHEKNQWTTLSPPE